VGRKQARARISEEEEERARVRVRVLEEEVEREQARAHTLAEEAQALRDELLARTQKEEARRSEVGPFDSCDLSSSVCDLSGRRCSRPGTFKQVQVLDLCSRKPHHPYRGLLRSPSASQILITGRCTLESGVPGLRALVEPNETQFGTHACRDGCYHRAVFEPMLVLMYVSPAYDFLGTQLIQTIWGLDSSWCLCDVAASCRTFDGAANPEFALTFVSAGGGSPWVRHLFRALESGEATRGPHLWARHILHSVRIRLLSNRFRSRQKGKAGDLQVSFGLSVENEEGARALCLIRRILWKVRVPS
jgi:hypothetical protein